MKEVSTTKPASQEVLKELLQVEKRRPELKPLGKGKQTSTVVERLKDKSSKLISIQNKWLRDTHTHTRCQKLNAEGGCSKKEGLLKC